MPSKKNSESNRPLETSIKYRLLALLFLCLFAGGLYGQIPIKTYTTATDTFYWKRYVHIPRPEKIHLKKISESGYKKEIDRFIAQNTGDFQQFTNDSLSNRTLKDLRKSLYPTEINGDGKIDLIFSGFSGGLADITRIYLNRGDSFELVFEDYQYLTKFMRKNGLLTSLQTGDPGCGEDYLYFTRDYEVKWEESVPVFIKGKQTVAYKYTEEPREYWDKTIPFRSVSDTMMVRASAARLNEPFIPRLETFGNIIAKYRQKTRGAVLAVKNLGKGNTWYFVELFPGVAPAASILYEADKVPTFLRGWVSGQSVILDR